MNRAITRRREDYVWLGYSVFYFIDPILRGNLVYWLECLGIFCVFLAFYALYVESRRTDVRWFAVCAIYVVAVVTIPFDGGASCLFVFAAALMAFVAPNLTLAAVLIAAEAACVGLEWLLLRHNPINYAMTVLSVLIVGTANLFMAQQKRAACRLRAAEEENVALAGVAERERIARDLHDVLGHTLSVIVLKAELARRLVGVNNDRAAQEIAEVEQTARTALAEVRETIVGFRTKGLVAEVEQARRTLDAAGVALKCESGPPVLGAIEETVLTLAVREAVTNIVRHAGATRCTMRFADTGDGFNAMVVEDDGRGAGAGEGNGLRGMRERVQALGGRFRVESDSGTKVIVELPQGAR